MKRLLSPRTDARDQWVISTRDAEWLSEYCCDEAADEGKAALARALCEMAVKRFCDRPLSRPAYDSYSPSFPEASLTPLIKALAASGCEDGLSQVIRLVLDTLGTFDMGDCQVRVLKALIPWSRKRFGSIPPPLVAWLNSVRQRLESATEKLPEPPADCARAAEVDCKRQYCTRLNAFLADPANGVGRISAKEYDRGHLIDTIRRHQCDQHVLERKGSPVTLVFTKTCGSYDRAVERYHKDLRRLSGLPVAE